MVIRDATGRFIAARSHRGDDLVDSYVGELLAAKAGLIRARDLGLQEVELKGIQSMYGEALRMVRKIDQTWQYISWEISYLYSSWFKNFKCSFAPWHWNRAANGLANFAEDTSLKTGLDQPPDFLVHILLFDLSR